MSPTVAPLPAAAPSGSSNPRGRLWLERLEARDLLRVNPWRCSAPRRSAPLPCACTYSRRAALPAGPGLAPRGRTAPPAGSARPRAPASAFRTQNEAYAQKGVSSPESYSISGCRRSCDAAPRTAGRPPPPERAPVAPPCGDREVRGDPDDRRQERLHQLPRGVGIAASAPITRSAPAAASAGPKAPTLPRSRSLIGFSQFGFDRDRLIEVGAPPPTATEVDTAARERATEIRSFDFGVPQEELEDLRRRIAEQAYPNS